MYKTFLAALFSPMIYIYFWANPTLDTKYTKLKLFKLQKTQNEQSKCYPLRPETNVESPWELISVSRVRYISFNMSKNLPQEEFLGSPLCLSLSHSRSVWMRMWPKN